MEGQGLLFYVGRSGKPSDRLVSEQKSEGAEGKAPAA